MKKLIGTIALYEARIRTNDQEIKDTTDALSAQPVDKTLRQRIRDLRWWHNHNRFCLQSAYDSLDVVMDTA